MNQICAARFESRITSIPKEVLYQATLRPDDHTIEESGNPIQHQMDWVTSKKAYVQIIQANLVPDLVLGLGTN